MEVLIQIDLFSLPEVQETVKSKKEAFERLNSVHLKGIKLTIGHLLNDCVGHCITIYM